MNSTKATTRRTKTGSTKVEENSDKQQLLREFRDYVNMIHEMQFDLSDCINAVLEERPNRGPLISLILEEVEIRNSMQIIAHSAATEAQRHLSDLCSKLEYVYDVMDLYYIR